MEPTKQYEDKKSPFGLILLCIVAAVVVVATVFWGKF
jgi:hypothetical protein